MYNEQNIMVFTDGSMKTREKEILGYGACLAILIPIGNNKDIIQSDPHIGILTNNVECEVA